MVKTCLFIALLLQAVAASAQMRGTIANAETGVPMRDVDIFTNTGASVKTDWSGQYAILQAFTSVTIVKKDFVSLTLDRSEMTDTIYLLPRFNTLAEVVVWGKRTRLNPNAIHSWQPSFVPNTPATGGIGGLDILGLFKKKRPMSAEEVKKHKEIMREY